MYSFLLHKGVAPVLTLLQKLKQKVVYFSHVPDFWEKEARRYDYCASRY